MNTLAYMLGNHIVFGGVTMFSRKPIKVLGSILRGTGGSGMLAYPKAEVILVFLDKREISRAALPNRPRV